MTKRKFIRLSKEQKSLLIALLIGDGTISSNYVFKLSHSTLQREYLEWKVELLNKYGIKNNGVKEYISKCGYNTGKSVLYSQMSLIPTIKALRRSVYTPKKTITRKLLEWLNPLGLAIWYMDDGFKHDKTYHFCTDCFSTKDVKLLQNVLKHNFDLDTTVDSKNRIRIKTSSAKQFKELILPYIHENMLYKLH